MTTVPQQKKPANWKRWLEVGAIVLLGVLAHLGVQVAGQPAAVPPEPPLAVTDVTDRTISLTSPDLQKAGVRSVGVVIPGTAEPPVPESQTRAEVVAAIGRVRFGGGACTGQAVHPRRPDRRWDIVCAAHCVSGVGQRGEMRLKDGRQFAVEVAAIDRNADGVWLRTVDPHDSLPAVLLADAVPERGTKVWHAGYGWDRPENVEEGEVASAVNGDGKQAFLLNLSQGDSGGGFFRADTNRLVSTACCTTQIAAKALSFGCNVDRLRQLRTTAAKYDDWVPAEVPQCDPTGKPLPPPPPAGLLPVPARMPPDGK